MYFKTSQKHIVLRFTNLFSTALIYMVRLDVKNTKLGFKKVHNVMDFTFYPSLVADVIVTLKLLYTNNRPGDMEPCQSF